MAQFTHGECVDRIAVSGLLRGLFKSILTQVNGAGNISGGKADHNTVLNPGLNDNDGSSMKIIISDRRSTLRCSWRSLGWTAGESLAWKRRQRGGSLR